MYEDYYYTHEDPAGFLRRIRLDPGTIRPDRESLDRILYNHHRYVPFENLTIWAEGTVPDLGVPGLTDKIVSRSRGGYCFEMNGHLEAVLKAIGYETYSVEVRITRGRDFLPPVRHRAVVVVIDGRKHFCDVGLGFKFFPACSEYGAGYNAYGVRADLKDGAVTITSMEEGREQVLLRFRDLPALPVDFVNPNFCCAGDPNSGFRTRLSTVIMTAEGYRKTLVCSEPAPKAASADSPEFTITVTDGSRTVSSYEGKGTADLERCLRGEYGIDYHFGRSS